MLTRRFQLARRGITEAAVRAVLASPEEVREVRPGRVVAQAFQLIGDPPSPYLLRIVVDVDRDPPEVVTAYRTSKIGKYRRLS